MLYDMEKMEYTAIHTPGLSIISHIGQTVFIRFIFLFLISCENNHQTPYELLFN